MVFSDLPQSKLVNVNCLETTLQVTVSIERVTTFLTNDELDSNAINCSADHSKLACSPSVKNSFCDKASQYLTNVIQLQGHTVAVFIT